MMIKKIIIIIALMSCSLVLAMEQESAVVPYKDSSSDTDSEETMIEESSNQSDDEITFQEPAKKKSRSGICKQCNREYQNLSKHDWAMHGKGSEMISCKKPGCIAQVVASGMPSHLKNVHGEGAKSTPCPRCGKQVNVSGLQAHINRNHGTSSNKINCPRCNKQVAIYALQKHLKNHDENIYVGCPVCSEKVKQKSLNHHLKRHRIIWKCKQCSQEFNSHTGISLHLQKTHHLSVPWRDHYTTVEQIIPDSPASAGISGISSPTPGTWVFEEYTPHYDRAS